MDGSDATVLATATEKTAALFFPHVIPLNYWNVANDLTSEEEQNNFNKVLPGLLPQSLNSTDIPNRLVQLVDYTMAALDDMRNNEVLCCFNPGDGIFSASRQALDDLEGADDPTEFSWERYADFTSSIISQVKSPIAGVVGLLPPSEIGTTKQESVSCLISGISNVDTSKITWDQILDIRNNPDAMRRLRQFRIFFQKNFDGEDSDYIKDALAEMRDKHAENLKSLGVPTFESVFECIFSSETLRHSFIVAVLACGMGSPIDSSLISSLGAGMVISLNNLRIEFKNRRIEKSKLIDNYPLTYLFEDV